MPALLASADIYVAATLSDGASISLLEAMASGLFPIVTDLPGNREWLTGDGDGPLNPGDDARLASRLEQAICDPSLRASAALLNRRTVEARGEREVNLARLGTIYDALRDRFGR